MFGPPHLCWHASTQLVLATTAKRQHGAVLCSKAIAVSATRIHVTAPTQPPELTASSTATNREPQATLTILLLTRARTTRGDGHRIIFLSEPCQQPQRHTHTHTPMSFRPYPARPLLLHKVLHAQGHNQCQLPWMPTTAAGHPRALQTTSCVLH